MINGDISSCFPSIPHEVVMRLLGKSLSCARSLEIIQKALKFKVKDNKGKILTSNVGTPQGSVISPILSNIVLNELDLYIQSYKEKFEVGTKRAVNKKYHSLNATRHKTKNPEIRARNLASMMLMNPKDTQDKNFKRLLYVRYADDFVILLISSQQEAFTLRRGLKDFLKHKLGLELNLEKTTIGNTKEGFGFIGAKIKKVDPVIVSTNLRNKSNHVIRKRTNRRLVINAPLPKLILIMIKNKFAKRNHLNKVIATSRKDLVNHTHFEILNFYN